MNLRTRVMKGNGHRIWPLPGLKRSNKTAIFFFQPIKQIKEALGPRAADDTAVLWEPGFLWIVPDEHNTERMCSSAVCRKPYSLMYVSDHLKIQGMCWKSVMVIGICTSSFKTQRMCNEAVKKDPYAMEGVPDHLETRGMCDRAVQNNPYAM